MTMPFTRCPSCGAVDWPPEHRAVHRPRCPHDNTDPSTWEVDHES